MNKYGLKKKKQDLIQELKIEQAKEFTSNKKKGIIQNKIRGINKQLKEE